LIEAHRTQSTGHKHISKEQGTEQKAQRTEKGEKGKKRKGEEKKG